MTETPDTPETPDLPDVPPPGALPEDPALAAAVLEIEAHVAQDGWDQPARLYALVDTAELIAQEPALAAVMSIDGPGDEGSFTPIEQEGLPPGQALEDALPSIAWPESVAGCAAVIERLVLPPEVDDEIPDDPTAAELFAREHPHRQEVRMVAGVTRAGASYCALRLRAHDDEQSVVNGTELVPGLLDLLHATLHDTDPDAQSDTPHETSEQGPA
ncbi:PPA1309 family protein [Nocardioides renjunii]|uniref:PPA1309 family protein n=1 Tax=Nocardioides renjunii TaxID=3095075 RepID=UPI002AFE7385|nr:PPA1309 family protein [Nocardioides sp. S-34]WQQ23533.1 PPA1309 family protein [Nocardioides sp. S-34]